MITLSKYFSTYFNSVCLNSAKSNSANIERLISTSTAFKVFWPIKNAIKNRKSLRVHLHLRNVLGLEEWMDGWMA